MPKRSANSSQPASNHPRNTATNTWDRAAFESQITALEQSLQALRSRFDQVCRDLARQQQLEQQQQQLSQQPQTAELEKQLQTLQIELNNLEIALESQLLSWRGFGNVFWQTVRFTGLGVVLGWCLKALSSG
jgi:chromosome segregation ATPase